MNEKFHNEKLHNKNIFWVPYYVCYMINATMLNLIWLCFVSITINFTCQDLHTLFQFPHGNCGHYKF